jgi:hypothetical protein
VESAGVRAHRKCGTGFRIGSVRIEVTTLLTAEQRRDRRGKSEILYFSAFSAYSAVRFFRIFGLQFLVLSSQLAMEE